jgi:DNA ligase (NAD+)
MSKTISNLVEYLNKCRDEYYNHNNSIITDKQYDELFDSLKKLEEESGIILTNSPTHTVGYTALSNLEKVEHAYPLLSLDKTQSYDDVVKFCKDHKVLFMHKVDGLTCQLTYIDGKFVRAETRGDGYIGEDITHNAKTFIGVPDRIPFMGVVHITGEAIINRKDFIEINTKLNDMYKNPRNLASGSVRQLDSSICAKRKVRFIVWNANELTKMDSMLDGLEIAGAIGFTVVHNATLHNINKDSLETLFTNMKNHTQIDYIPIDGIVAMYDSISYGNSLGKTEHHFKNGLAFKFYDDSYETTLNNVEFTIGKTGVLTPTAVFDPVEIEGTTVTRASVHNISILKNLNLCIGDSIEVFKANLIIPNIRQNNTKHYNPSEYKKLIPKTCPYCDAPAEIRHNEESDVDTLFCTNTKCVGILTKKISAFVSKQAMNIDGLSEKTIEKFIKLGYLKSYSDIYALCNIRYTIENIDGFGKKSVESLMNSIEQSKTTTLERLLIALNIDNVGRGIAKDLSKFFNNNTNDIRAKIQNKNKLYQDLTAINGFGETLAKSVIEWFSDYDNIKEFDSLCHILTIESADQKVTSNILSGMNFVITGKLTQFKNRDELVKMITNFGGNVQSSVTSSTTYLINNDVESTSGKNKKAKELGIKIISENDFIKMTDVTIIQKTDNTISKRSLF